MIAPRRAASNRTTNQVPALGELRPSQLRSNSWVASAHTMAASPVHSAATQSFALTRSSRDCPPLFDLQLHDHFAFLDNIFSTVIAHDETYVRQCTTSGLPHKCRHTFRALKMNLARGQARLCCCDFIFNARRHTPTTTNGPRVRSSDIDFQIDSLLIFFSVS